MSVAWKTEPGLVRTTNEDKILIDAERGIFLLADGLGGHNAGEIASDLAVNEAYAFILREMIRAVEEQAILGIMEEALCCAHRAIQAKASTDMNLRGMGTTLVELYIQGSHAYVCHAGDSRAYLFRNVLERITRDHTVGDAYVEQGSMERGMVPPRLWHILTQAVGTGNCPVPDKKVIDLARSDILLMCSDGLTDMLTDDEIQDIVISQRNALETMVETLARDANIKGGKDNISVIAIGP
ncbi:MAG: protein phosphatase 2C domain-containing protein [Thermodesulfovibrionales bacterium]